MSQAGSQDATKGARSPKPEDKKDDITASSPKPTGTATSTPLSLFGVVQGAYESDSDDSDSDSDTNLPQTASSAISKIFASQIKLYEPHSLGLFYYTNPVRKVCFYIVNQPYFEWIIFLLLVITAVFNILAANIHASHRQIEANSIVGVVILIIFTIEALMRIIAHGFVRHKLSYLRDPWNVFDLIVVIAGWVDVFTPEFSGIYAIQIIPRMRALARGILLSLPALAGTGGLFILVFLVCGIVGVKLFKGSFQGRCYTADGELVDSSRVCSLKPAYGYHCNQENLETCQRYGNPNYGFTSFDNFAWSQLTVFQLLTVEGWTDDLYYSQDGVITAITWIYFVIVVVIGSFFLLNLVTAVLCDKIGESISVNIPTLFSNSDISAVVTGAAVETLDGATPGAGGAAGGVAGGAAGGGASGSAASGGGTDDGGKGKVKDDGDGSNTPARTRFRRSTFLYASDSVSFVATPNSDKGITIVSDNTTLDTLTSSPNSSRRPNRPAPATPSNLSPPPTPGAESPTLSPSSSTKLLVPKVGKGADQDDENSGATPHKTYDRIDDGSNIPVSPTPATAAPHVHKRKKTTMQPMPAASPADPISDDPTSASMLAGMFSGIFADVYTNYFPETLRKRMSYFDRVVRPKLNAILTSFYFELAVFLIVIIHTVILATQHWDMNESHKHAIFVVDRIFIALFTLEVLMRMQRYFAHTKVNWLDMIVLIGCWIELGLVAGGSLRRGIYISVFRLFRVFELIRISDIFQNSADSIIACIKIAANPAALYAMIGVSAFSDPAHFPNDDNSDSSDLSGRPRQNFDNFLHAALCVFQVLTGENWNNLLYDGMRYSYGAIPYVLLAFFLAVMVDVYAETNPVILQRKLFGILSKYKSKKLSRNFGKFVGKFKGTAAAKSATAPSDDEDAPSVMNTISSLPLRLTGVMSGFFRERSEYSYWIFPLDTPLRDAVDYVIFHRYYQRLSMIVVVFSCVVAALYLPHDASPHYNATLQKLELFFAVFFLAEVFCKGLARNFVFGRKKYLQDVWSVLDFLVIVISSITTFTTRYKFFVVFRAFRPLQLVTAYKPLRYFAGIPARTGLVEHVCYFWGAAVVWFFPTVYCCSSMLRWENPHYSFDNFGRAMLSLFEVSTLEELTFTVGWLDAMHAAMDATDPGKAPVRNYRGSAALFFVFFIVGAVFFLLNLFMAVVTNQFFIVYEKESGLAFMDQKQREWKETKRLTKQVHAIIRPKPPESPWIMQKIYYIVFHKRFEIAMTLLVCLNMVVFMMDHYKMNQRWTHAIFIFTLFFSMVYVVELLFKLYFFGIEAFVRSKVFRVFRVVKISRKLRVLIATLWNDSFTQHMNSLVMNGAVFLILCILLYIYAVIGIHFYANIVWGDYLNVHANFNNFPSAILTLFRMTTGENWNGIMHDCMVQEPYCSEQDGTCGTYWAILYYVSFQMIGTFMFLPLFVAVILRQFQDENSAENFVLSPTRLAEFRKIWQKFDPYGKQRINVSDLYYFLSKLPPPLGIGRHKRTAYNTLIKKLSLKPTVNGHIYFQLLVRNLTAVALGVEFTQKRNTSTLSHNASNLAIFNKSSKKLEKMARDFRQGENLLWFVFAVVYIQRTWRARRRKRQINEEMRNPNFIPTAESESSRSLKKDEKSLSTIKAFKNPTKLQKSLAKQNSQSSLSSSAPPSPTLSKLTKVESHSSLTSSPALGHPSPPGTPPLPRPSTSPTVPQSSPTIPHQTSSPSPILPSPSLVPRTSNRRATPPPPTIPPHDSRRASPSPPTIPPHTSHRTSPSPPTLPPHTSHRATPPLPPPSTTSPHPPSLDLNDITPSADDDE